MLRVINLEELLEMGATARESPQILRRWLQTTPLCLLYPALSPHSLYFPLPLSLYPLNSNITNIFTVV